MEKDLELSELSNREKIPLENFCEERKFDFSHKVLEIVKKRFYIVNWLPEYDQTKAIGDFIAGITIGLTMIPQSLAYANLANVPAVYGLYSAFAGSIIYMFLGTVREVSIGPTSLMSILTVSYTYEKPIEYVFIMTFVCGCIEMLMGIFRLGFLVDFISVPVVSAFSTSTALLIIVSQLKNLLGINFKAKSFPSTIVGLFKNIEQIKLGDTVLGVCAIIFLIVMKSPTPCQKIQVKLFQQNLPNLGRKSDNAYVKRFLFYLSLARNALLVLITALIAFSITNFSDSEVPFKLSETVPPGIPNFQPPQFTAQVDNTTISFIEICSDIGSGLFLLPLISILANVAIAKSFSTGKIVDATQEMIALGMCNVLGSFFKSIPTCGAFTRSAVSNASGVQTPFAGIYSAILALLALTLLTPYFNFIPKATLAAILICAVISLIDFKIASKIWEKSKIDFLSWSGCILTCMAVGVETGLIFGIILSATNILIKSARPRVLIYIEKSQNDQQIYVKPSSGIFYPGIDYIREQIHIAVVKTDFKYSVVMDLAKISSVDYTSLKGFEAIVKDLKKFNLSVKFINVDENLQRRLYFDQ